MNIFDLFPEFPTVTGSVYHNVSVNSGGLVTDTPTLLQASVKAKKWIDASVETNTSDQFVNQETGTICFSPGDLTFTPSTTQWYVVGSDTYYFTGVNNIIGSDEIYQISYRKERK